MKFKVKSFKIGAGKPIIFLHSIDAKKLKIHIGDRIGVLSGNKRVIGVIDLVENYFKHGEIGISHELMKKLGVESGDLVELVFLPLSNSTRYIQKKLSCTPYTKKELFQIISDINNNFLSEAEIAYFVSGVYHCGMSIQETIYLTEAIYKTGNKINWHSSKIVDKHSIGGIPGNRTTPIVVSICAAAGLIMPKTSSRAITSAAGTADVIESIARVNLSIKDIKSIVKKAGACLAWGGSLGLAPADDKLIQVEKVLNLDPKPQLIASILAKKLAVGSKYVLIDIPYGHGAKVSKGEAEKLKEDFFKIARYFKLKIKVVLTDGSQPIGNGIGPILEIKDVLRVLRRNDSPKDLESKCLTLSGAILEMTGKAKKGEGKKMALEILDSGKAYSKFEQIIKLQEGKLNHLKKAKFIHTIRSNKNGKIGSINNKDINRLARLAGSPIDKTAGLYLRKHRGEKVRKGEAILEIHTESKPKMNRSLAFYEEMRPILVV